MGIQNTVVRVTPCRPGDCQDPGGVGAAQQLPRGAAGAVHLEVCATGFCSDQGTT